MTQSISMQRDSDNQMLRVWLKRSLHAQFDGIIREPVPDTLLCLLREDPVTVEHENTAIRHPS